MTICKKCNQHLADIMNEPHRCPGEGLAFDAAPKLIRIQQKCEICGSTAIDHTEQQCQLNRVIRRNP